MKNKRNNNIIFLLKKQMPTIALMMAIVIVLSVSVYAWFGLLEREIGGYIPVASPQALYIGAGHVSIDSEGLFTDIEDIRYLYISGLDVNEQEYKDYLFCIYGKAVPKFKIQIGYTTNNQFEYELYNASESEVGPSGIEYTTHGLSPSTYYYTMANQKINGVYLNRIVDNGEYIGDPNSKALSYGTYSNVNKYAVPIYWQSEEIDTGTKRGSFVMYFVLRVKMNGKVVNDKETDIILISATSNYTQ